jgi:hypothetical protein
VLPEPFCHFCRHHNPDGSWSFDYSEHHAILLGACVPFFMWPFMVKHSTEAKRLISDESWYVAGGMAGQLLALVLLLRRRK